MSTETISVGFLTSLQVGEELPVDPRMPASTSSSSNAHPHGSARGALKPSPNSFHAMVSTIIFVEEDPTDMEETSDRSTSQNHPSLPAKKQKKVEKDHEEENVEVEPDTKKKNQQQEGEEKREEGRMEVIRVSLMAILRDPTGATPPLECHLASAQFSVQQDAAPTTDATPMEEKGKKGSSPKSSAISTTVKEDSIAGLLSGRKRSRGGQEGAVASVRLRAPLAFSCPRSPTSNTSRANRDSSREAKQNEAGVSSKESQNMTEEDWEEGRRRVDHLRVDVENIDAKTGARLGTYEGPRRFAVRLAGLQETTLTQTQIELLLKKSKQNLSQRK